MSCGSTFGALQLHGLLEHGDAVAEGDAVADAGDALVAALLQVLHAHDDAAVLSRWMQSNSSRG